MATHSETKRWDKEIKNLKNSSKELFEALKCILEDEYLALGYLGIFEEIVKKDKIKFAQKVGIKVSKIQKANITLLDQSTIDKIINEILKEK